MKLAVDFMWSLKERRVKDHCKVFVLGNTNDRIAINGDETSFWRSECVERTESLVLDILGFRC